MVGSTQISNLGNECSGMMNQYDEQVVAAAAADHGILKTFFCHHS
jgi:hypothetical protein